MPRKTRRQLVGKQEDVERQEREEALRLLELELRLAQIAKIIRLLRPEVEPVEDDKSQSQAQTMPLTVPA
jgi:hypothetical protein